jgi:predicted acylesterase/phospholipase RssA
MKRVPTRLVFGLSMVGLVLAGCVFPFNQVGQYNPLCSDTTQVDGMQCIAYATKDFKVIHRSLAYDPDLLGKDYGHEHAYIAQRRGGGPNQPVTLQRNLTGLALSGGGLRSATFNLGVLQALQDMKTKSGKPMLSRMDYLSTVSGGSYIAGWMVGHLHASEDRALYNIDDKGLDKTGYLVETSEPERLLNDHEDFVKHLRARSDFIKEGSWWEGPRLIGSFLWRLPLHLAWTIGLHVQTIPTINNGLHPYVLYRDRIEKTYLRGKETLAFAEINGDPARAPYLIVNGNLANSGPMLSRPDVTRTHYNFEFTRDFVGSDGIGYIETPGFGWPNDKAPRGAGGARAGTPDAGTVQVHTLEKLRIADAEGTMVVIPSGSAQRVAIRAPDGTPARARARWRGPCDDLLIDGVTKPDGTAVTDETGNPLRYTVHVWTPCVRLSDAMAASGAAIDSVSIAEEKVRSETGGFLASKLLAPLNVDFGYRTWNFAWKSRNAAVTAWDNLLMLTLKRLTRPSTEDPWLEITDGSFFDNLGVYSLLRRGVQHIIATDVTWDPSWKYHYLHNLKERVTSHDELDLTWCGEIPAEDAGEIVWYRRFWVATRDKKPLAVIHYLKPFAFNPYLFESNLTMVKDPEDPRKLYVSLGGAPEHRQFWDKDKRAPAHLQPLVSDTPEMERARKKVAYFAKSGRTADFPQTSTAYQWYDMEHFEAYQSLGYLMAKAYLAKLEFTADDLTPLADCQGL